MPQSHALVSPGRPASGGMTPCIPQKKRCLPARKHADIRACGRRYPRPRAEISGLADRDIRARGQRYPGLRTERHLPVPSEKKGHLPQNGRSSLASPAKKSGAGAAIGGGTGAPACMGAAACDCTAGSTFQARMRLNQRSCHWLASMSKDTFNSCPICILNCAIRSAPNTSKHIRRGYCPLALSSMTYS